MTSLTPIDYGVIAAYLLISLGIGIGFSRRASTDTGEFFLSGRKLPWWVAGTAMVATTFAADTPLAVAGFVARHGIAGNWVWWTFVSGGMLTVFFFARLWRRANILTDLEFIELRYSGPAARFLRAFKALYFGLFINAIIIGWVNLAMVKIIRIMAPELDPTLTIIAIVALTTLYSGLSGLWGVAITDAIQFIIAMTGCIILAVLALNAPQITTAGGLTKALPGWMFDFLPSGTGYSLPILSFAAMAFVQWWASWYPGAEPGGGGYVAQRMMSAKNEEHSLLATLWFTIAHYCLRPWPWIIVGLASLVMFPDLPANQKEDGFVYVMQALLPVGLRGLLVAAFLAAYMSTLSTHLNWGTSYLVNDAWRRFIRPHADEAHYVAISRIFTIIMAIASLIVTFFILDTITGAWEFILQCGAGTGFVLIMRWFWWRLNAWSEITAMIVPFITYALLQGHGDAALFPVSLFIIAGTTIAATLLVTWLTPPTDREQLKTFYRTTRVGGRLWRPIARELPDVQADHSFGRLFLDWALGIIMIYAILYGTGQLLFHSTLTGAIAIAIGLAAGALILLDLTRRGWNSMN